MDEPKSPTVEEHLPLVRFLAKKMMRRLPNNIELDDLISSGVIGLMDAIGKHDPSRENKFTTYAEFRIWGAMLDYLRDIDLMPRSARADQKAIELKVREIAQKTGRQPDDEEVIRALADTERSARRLRHALRGVEFLSTEGSFSPSDRLAILRHIMESQQQEEKIDFSEYLDGRDLYIVNRYIDGYTLKAIGREIGVTESGVQQILNRAICWISHCRKKGIKGVRRRRRYRKNTIQLELREAS